MLPTHTTQRVPKRSSKPMSRVGSVTGRAIEPGEGELVTDAAAGCGGGEGGGGTGSVVMLGAGAAGCVFSGSAKAVATVPPACSPAPQFSIPDGAGCL
jgi:hypothetical protein